MTRLSSSGQWEEALPRFSLNRRITVIMMMLSAIVIGVVASFGIPLELIPRGYNAPQLVVRATWRDSPPREVLDKIVLPLEDELSTVRGLDQLNSWSETGQGEIHLSFKQGTDMDVAYREVRDRVLRTRPLLPDDLDPVRISKQSSSSLPIMAIGIAIDPSVTDVYNLIQREIVTPLSRVEGVASVVSPGLQEKEVLIELDRAKTAAAGLNIYLVSQELQADNFSLASGTIRHGPSKLLLRSMSRFETIADIGNQLIATNVRLSDIASVKLAEPDMFWVVRVNSKPALAMQIFKEGQANTIDVSKRLAKAFEVIRANPKLHGSDMAVLFSQGDVIEESLSTLLDNGKLGAFLAAIVLLFFLRRFRLTAIITLSIPLSLILSLTVMYFVGETLNILSLLGLIISVGLLVDNSVVVAENIMRIRAEGASRRDACIRGAAEIALAIILATLTTIIVFLPVSLVEGKGQFFLLRLAIPITVSLAASLLVALIFVPLCVYATLQEKDHQESKVVRSVHILLDAALGFLYKQSLGRLSSAYSKILAFFLVRRLDLIAILLIIFAGTLAGPGSGVNIVQVSDDDRTGFALTTEMPDNYSLADAATFFESIEPIMEQARTEIGLDGFFVFHTATYGEIQGWFKSGSKMKPKEAAKWVRDRLPERPGIKYFSGNEDRGKNEEDQSTHTLVLGGEDPERLEQIAKKLEAQLLKVTGVTGVKGNKDLRPNEVALVIDRRSAAMQSVNPQHVAGVVAAGLRGQSLPRFQNKGNSVPVRLRFERSATESLAQLADFSIPSMAGGMVPLSSLSDFQFQSSSRGIFREEKRIARRITLDLLDGEEEDTRKRINAMLSEINLPEGIRFHNAGAARAVNEDMESMKFAAYISILFIYLLMGFLFESFILPLSIIFTIPAAAIGVIWAHALAGRDLDNLGFVGVILLIGVVVNNGIVVVDYINRLRQEGIERGQAVILATQRRFRPIMMTAFTTIGGMIPLTVGAPSSIGLSYRSFGLTLMGGMATATALTLLVVPVFYTVLDDASRYWMTLIGRAVKGKKMPLKLRTATEKPAESPAND